MSHLRRLTRNGSQERAERAEGTPRGTQGSVDSSMDSSPGGAGGRAHGHGADGAGTPGATGSCGENAVGVHGRSGQLHTIHSPSVSKADPYMLFVTTMGSRAVSGGHPCSTHACWPTTHPFRDFRCFLTSLRLLVCTQVARDSAARPRGGTAGDEPQQTHKS
jgi:hypothetical protein